MNDEIRNRNEEWPATSAAFSRSSLFPFSSLLSLLSSLLVLLAGCGDSGPKTIPVTGTVTFDGGSMPGPGILFFTSIEPAEGFTQHPGTARFDADGTYTVKTFQDGDGLTPGRYGVTVFCWKTAPTMDSPQGESHLPEKYGKAVTSGLTLTVDADSRRIVYDIPLEDR